MPITLRAAATPLLACTLAASGGVIRHDVPDASYIALAAQGQFDPVGSLYRDGDTYSCSATLVAPGWVLTAGHCSLFNPSPLSFELGGAVYEVTQRVVHPDFLKSNGDDANHDLALLRLAAPVTNVNPAALYEGSDDIGATMTSVGLGWTGDGVTGFIPGTEGVKRAGNNSWDALGDALGLSETILLADFDSPLDASGNLFGDASPLDLEYLIVPGDSGGGTFIQEDGQWYLAGVHSFILGTTGEPTGMYGDGAGIVRVNMHNDWIESVIPAPASCPVLFTALLAAVPRRRRDAHAAPDSAR